ncbi:hypothetical protein PFISCL1PPCAC_12928 [Pristionchus fissidentatus]|uniref:Uncharacterized protein n=1 Tax=Pristionchus fissidentatus TaxID=1538716 RepID=A0AAV5VPV1_9BILA|nr:hypothetical protein PFISCL1PPCAC_12928 [Pristionchus fissidentatus]
MIGAGCLFFVALPSILCLVIGLLGLLFFPSLYQNIVYAILVLGHNDYTGSVSFSTQMFSKPPMINQMKFFMFNITNADEIIYEGAVPRLIEIGPYTYMESEEKRYLQYRDDDDQVFYENYKKWIYRPDLSCERCNYDDIVTLPNGPQVGVATALFDTRFYVSPAARKIISLALLALGEEAINSPQVGAVLFDGYPDPLLSAAHSGIVTVLSDIFNGGVNIIPLPVPDMHTFGYFNEYNNTRDENYWVHTGKKDITKVGRIVTWNDQTLLPEDWWTTTQARMINGSDTGSFAHVALTEKDVLPMFHSYMCRSFNAVYQGRREVAGIPSITFGVEPDEWDTTLEKNKGFRYKNDEQINYYPEWPTCPNWNASNCVATKDDPVDCFTDICNNCCQRGKVGDTYALPPGLFQMVCYPGRMKMSPFAILWSTPHFLYSPQAVVDSVVGLHPSVERHKPMIYDYEPMSGLVSQVSYRAQINMPFFSNKYVLQNSHLRSTLVPILYESDEAVLTDYAYSLYRIGFIYGPNFVLGFSIAFIFLSVCLAVLFVVLLRRRNRTIKLAL